MANTFLTEEGYKNLQEELDYLRTTKRNEVANRLHEAMDGGELIENAEYEAAKNEQAFVEGRIQESDLILASAKIIDDNGKHDVAQVGSKVTIKEEEGDVSTYTIVGAAEANPKEGFISNESPFGISLLIRIPLSALIISILYVTFNVKILKVG